MGRQILVRALLIFLCVSHVAAADDRCADPVSRISIERIREELATQRAEFLSKGRFVDIFSALYFATTIAMLEKTALMNADDARLMNELIILFYEAFEFNRKAFEAKGASATEQHWKAYYRAASRLEHKKDVSAFDVLALVMDGVDAHLNDLPRSLRVQMKEKPDSIARLKMLYFEFDSVFPQVVRDFENDIGIAMGKRGVPAPAFSPLNVGRNYVVHGRLRAWEMAIGRGKRRAEDRRPKHCRNND